MDSGRARRAVPTTTDECVVVNAGTSHLPFENLVVASGIRTLLDSFAVGFGHPHDDLPLSCKWIARMRREHVVQEQHIAIAPRKHDLFLFVGFADSVQVSVFTFSAVH